MKNGIIFQGFEWNSNGDGNYYKDMETKIDELKEMGITAFWLPPICKATGTNDTGYGVYDLFDLGEFDQRGSVRTKYGTKEELLHFVDKLHENGIDVYVDVVLNHKAGADRKEQFKAVKVQDDNRTLDAEDVKEIEGWTGFDFKGRKGKYSRFKWNFSHFTGVDYDALGDDVGIYRIIGENKGWNWGVSGEKGNFDYLIFTDVDLAHPDVKKELKRWADWVIGQVKPDGFRMDAVKHMDKYFMKEFVKHVRWKHGQDFYILGEYWANDFGQMQQYLAELDYEMDLFDVSLHFNFFEASKRHADYDLTKIFDNTLVQKYPTLAVTFVDNHDSQPHQSLESWVEPWFKEIAYGFILLRREGYPVIFTGDYQGLADGSYEGLHDPIRDIAQIRKYFAYGQQDDYFNNRNCVGWVRHGNAEHPVKSAIVISNAGMATLRMFVGLEQSGKTYADYLGNSTNKIVIDQEGFGNFEVGNVSISIWIEDGIDFEKIGENG